MYASCPLHSQLLAIGRFTNHYQQQLVDYMHGCERGKCERGVCTVSAGHGCCTPSVLVPQHRLFHYLLPSLVSSLPLILCYIRIQPLTRTLWSIGSTTSSLRPSGDTASALRPGSNTTSYRCRGIPHQPTRFSPAVDASTLRPR